MVARMTFSLARDFGLPLVTFAAALWVAPALITALFLVVGQAHFFMTFVYQYKGKKMNVRYLTFAFLCLLIAVGYFLLIGAYVPVFLLSGIAFGLHFAVDEFFLHRETITPGSYTTILGFMMLYGALILQVLGKDVSVLPYIAATFIVAQIVVRALLRQPFSSAERYLLFVAVLLFALAVLLGLWMQVLAVVILLHCANWIIGYGQKVHAHVTYRRAYWRDTVLTLGLSFGLYLLWHFEYLPVLSLLFLPMYWYAWAILHFILSSPLVVGAKRPIG